MFYVFIYLKSMYSFGLKKEKMTRAGLEPATSGLTCVWSLCSIQNYLKCTNVFFYLIFVYQLWLLISIETLGFYAPFLPSKSLQFLYLSFKSTVHCEVNRGNTLQPLETEPADKLNSLRDCIVIFLQKANGQSLTRWQRVYTILKSEPCSS